MTSTIARYRPHRMTRLDLRERAECLIRTEIDFIPNRGFATEGLHTHKSIVEDFDIGLIESPSDLPQYLRRLCETELLSHEDEVMLFREMNLLKYHANVLRSRLEPSTVTEGELSAIEVRLTCAHAIRDHIIHANIRLVISIVKKYVTPQQSFDELFSDGILTLMQAVEKFDFDRGFRFSTYAYRSIARNAYRTIMTARKEEARMVRDAEEWAFEQENRKSPSSMSDIVWSNLRDLMLSMIDMCEVAVLSTGYRIALLTGRMLRRTVRAISC